MRSQIANQLASTLFDVPMTREVTDLGNLSHLTPGTRSDVWQKRRCEPSNELYRRRTVPADLVW